MASLCVILLPVALPLSSCGLPGEQPSLLAPISVGDATSTNIFTFDNQPQVSPDSFYGFEIYYKFYDDSNGGADTQYYQDNGKLTSTATGPDQLVSFGYRRAYQLAPDYTQGTQITTQSVPLIPVTDASLKTTSFQVTIDLRSAFSSSTTTVYPQVDLNGAPVSIQSGGLSGDLKIARYMANDSVSGGYMLEGFGQSDFALDQGTGNGLDPLGDIPASLITNATQQGGSLPQPFLLGLYAISYGLVDFSTPIYSTPTQLGFVKYYTTFSSVSNPQ